MKKSTWFLLIASLAVNTALVVALVLRPSSGGDTAAATGVKGAAAETVSTGAKRIPGSDAMGAAKVREAATIAPTGAPKKLWDLLVSRDPATFAANLRAAGFQPAMVRGGVQALLRDLQAADRTKANALMTNTAYWKDSVTPDARAAYSKEMSRLTQERDRVMRSLFPEEREAFALRMQARYGAISETTMEKIGALEQDYSEMQSQARGATQSSILQMPWSGEALALLDREKLKDIAALLTPAELENYQMRGSPLGQNLQRQLDGFDPTEQEYRDIYRLRAVVDEATRVGGVFSGLTTEGMKARETMEAGLKSALGETRYAEYQRGQDGTYRAALEVTRTLDLPASKAVEVFEMQRDMRRREIEVQTAREMNPAQRQAQLAAIAAETRQKLSAILTPAGAEQYGKGQRGMLFIGN